MEQLSLESGFTPENLVYEGVHSVVYRAESKEFDRPLVAKILKEEHPGNELIQQFYNEFTIGNSIDSTMVRKVLQKGRLQNKYALLMEYHEGSTLKVALADQKMDLKQSLQLAVRIAEAVEAVHRSGVVHKDINPNNILIQSDGLSVQIIDFGISTRIDHKTSYVPNPDKLQGTLHYISPEQTGRMNRRIDSRSDLYSLGVTLYEWFAGKLPFHSEDALEMVHSHIAQVPVPPAEINKALPLQISDIILKLLAKNAEDRYQSVFGLKKDLERCLAQLTENGEIEEFDLGSDDFTGRLVLPQKLYGRSEELNVLKSAFETAIAGTSQLCFVKGGPGAGKSALVSELGKSLADHHFLSISGKFESLHKNVPYSAFIQAFKGLLELLLTERPEKLQTLKQQLSEALGDVGKVVTDVMPGLELIIGEQSELRELGPAETQNRFNFAMLRFVQTICNEHVPLVLFLDDLQWADSASLNLLETLSTDPNCRNLLVLGAYRDNEVTASHPFMQTVARIAQTTGVAATEVEVGNLSTGHVTELLVDALLVTSSEASKLADIVYAKTQGNAFFTGQFINALSEKELVKFNFEKRKWEWTVDAITKLEITDNVVTLMAQKLEQLPAETLSILKQAACIGTRFSLETLHTIIKGSEKEIVSQLLPALDSGLVIPLGNAAISLFREQRNEAESVEMSFVHDRVRQAAYSLISEQEKQAAHLSIGRLLQAQFDATHESGIFDVVNHFNEALPMIVDATEKKTVAELNTKAGHAAKKSNAYEAALEFFGFAEQLLGVQSWVNHELAVQRNMDKAECQYLLAHFDEAEQTVKLLLEKSTSALEKVNVLCIQQEIDKGRTDFPAALKTSLEALKILGEPLPEKPNKGHVMGAFIKTKFAIGGKKPDQLENLPAMTNPEKLAAMRMLARTGLTAYLVNPDLLPLISLKELQLSLKYGNSEYSAQSYGIYGFILGMMGNTKQSLEFEALSWKVYHRFAIPEMEGKVIMVTNGLINHWHKPLKDTVEPYLNALQKGRETGDPDVIFTSTILHWDHLYLGGTPLPELMSLVKEYLQLNKQTQAIHNLSEYVAILDAQLNGDYAAIAHINDNYTAETYLSHSNKAGLVKTQLQRGRILMQFGHAKTALACVDNAKVYYEATMGLVYQWTFHFYEALICLANCREEANGKLLKRAQQSLKKLQKWEKGNASTFGHMVALIQAEIAVLQGNGLAAVANYNKALDSAVANGFRQDEALINERFADYYLSVNQAKVAQIYLADALYQYRNYGAATKVAQLEGTHQLLTGVTKGGPATTMGMATTTNQRGSAKAMDFSTVTKAATAISSEIVLDKLLSKLIVLSVENAGAEMGYLLMKNGEEYAVEASQSLSSGELKVLQSEPLKDHAGISEAIVHYVLRTQESVVVANAQTDERFKSDTGIKSQEIYRSVLCVPILNQGKLLGALYLVNNLTEGAFTPERIEVLQILAGQAAVSLDNALLYKNLEDKVEERTEEIRHQKEIIEEKNNDILASIHYAKRIQTAILPKVPELDANLKHFVLFQPKDIVSGDFYWFHKAYGDEKQMLFAAADCTGHGVPGALMSMVGSNILNQVVGEAQVSKPSEVLEQLNTGVAKALQQTGEDAEGQTRDGMDIALCKLGYNAEGQGVVHYSGANRPLWIVRNDGELEEIKADKQPIGGGYSIQPFTNHELVLEKGTMLYTFSDGYPDQFGGERGRKFMTSKLKDLLQSIHQKPEDEQREHLRETFETWRGEHEQIDDVLIIGVRV